MSALDRRELEIRELKEQLRRAHQEYKDTEAEVREEFVGTIRKMVEKEVRSAIKGSKLKIGSLRLDREEVAPRVKKLVDEIFGQIKTNLAKAERQAGSAEKEEKEEDVGGEGINENVEYAGQHSMTGFGQNDNRGR